LNRKPCKLRISSRFQDGRIDEETTLNKLKFINEVVMAEPEFDGEEELLLIDSAQTSLVPRFLCGRGVRHRRSRRGVLG
jgi:hypothetical protein